MIQRILRMRDFDIYRDFSGGDQSGVPEFKTRNLIYGWNYSGKTNLSRLFQTLQFPDRPLPYAGCRFRAQFGAAEVSEINRIAPCPIRVFNRDYIDANFQHGHTAPAVFIVGEENLALRDRLNKLQGAQEQLVQRWQGRQGQIETIEDQLSTVGTERAGTVRQVLGVNDFRRPDLQTRVTQVRDAPAAHQLSNEVLQATIATFRSGDQFTEVALLAPHLLPDLRPEIETVRGLLGRTASFDAIEGLRENAQLEDWLRTGLGLHAAAGVCQFCEGDLPEERLNALRRHFSTASQDLLNAVNQAIARLQNLRFDPPRLEPMQLLQEIRDQARAELESLAFWLEWAETARDSFVAALEQKRTALETGLEWTGPEDRLGEGPETVEALNQCIRQHNESVHNIGPVRRQARTTVECHFAAVFFAEQNVAEREADIAHLRRRIGHAQRAQRRLRTAAEQIAEQIDRTTRGKQRFMELVAFLLRGSDIHVESRAEREFQLMRGTVPAEKLSEGEKTAIAFAYFLTSLEGEGEDIENTIVYVDDPISSLDSNHVYAVYALITERLQSARQLFVSTHNSEFFSLLKGLWLGRGPLESGSEAFYVRRQADAIGSFADLEPLPRLLRKFKSEYEFIFAQLHSFSSAQAPSDHEVYTAPNLLRRFLEAYLGFRKPCTAAWHEKLDMLLDSAEECREVHKLLDDASHLQNMNRALQQPAFVESAQACVQSIFLGLEAKDPIHYQSLVTVVNEGAAQITT